MGTCPYCESTIVRTTPRALDGDQGLTCLARVDFVEGSCPFCDRDVALRQAREAASSRVRTHTAHKIRSGGGAPDD